MVRKLKIAILFSGQIRENRLCNDVNPSVPENICPSLIHDILESYGIYFLTEDFKNECDYDIFIATDKIDIDKTLQYFGKDNVKNIYTEVDNTYLNHIESKIPNVQFYTDKIDNIVDKNYVLYPNCIYQYHRLALVYEMLNKYKDPQNYDYIIRSRLDYVYESNIIDYIRQLNTNPKSQLIGYDDQFAIGKPTIMSTYFDLINHYCTFEDHHLRNNFIDSLCTIDLWKKLLIEHSHIWKYASLQLYELLFQYCDNNCLDIDSTIHFCEPPGYIRKNIVIRKYVNIFSRLNPALGI